MQSSFCSHLDWELSGEQASNSVQYVLCDACHMQARAPAVSAWDVVEERAAAWATQKSETVLGLPGASF